MKMFIYLNNFSLTFCTRNNIFEIYRLRSNAIQRYTIAAQINKKLCAECRLYGDIRVQKVNYIFQINGQLHLIIYFFYVNFYMSPTDSL